jgi:hypothetical protein
VIEDAALVDELNAISLTCKTALDALLLDWLAADYPRNFAADSDRLKFSSNSPQRLRVTDLAGAELLAFDITEPENVSRSVNFQTSGGGPYSLEFTPPNGAAAARTYLVLSVDALLPPRAVTADAASNLTEFANGADYIVITHRNLGWDGNGDQYAWLTDLLAQRQAQGHRMMAVNLTDICDEFSFGLATPAATAAEAALMTAKIVSYENTVNTKTWKKNILLVSDNRTSDEEAAFESMNEDAAAVLPAALPPPFKAYLKNYGTAAALTSDIKDQIDAGSLLINYNGHASVQIWATERIFDNGDVPGLANDAGPSRTFWPTAIRPAGNSARLLCCSAIRPWC